MIDSHTHFVASRQGLYAVNASGWVKLVDGRFFGITLRDGTLYAFEAGGRPEDKSSRGRILAFTFDDTGITSAQCVADGLDNGCHQIDFIGDRLHVVDTYQQRVIVFSPCFRHFAYLEPFPKADYGCWARGYVHCNSLLGIGDAVLFMLHNGAAETGRPSLLLVCNQELKPMRQLLLPGKGCHNCVVLEDGSLLACGSFAGALINHERELVKLDDMMTRGLSVGLDQIAVGSSMYAVRSSRRDTAGRVHFLARDFTPLAAVELPAAPTDIRRIDGQDLSLSNFAGGLTIRF